MNANIRPKYLEATIICTSCEFESPLQEVYIDPDSNLDDAISQFLTESDWSSSGLCPACAKQEHDECRADYLYDQMKDAKYEREMEARQSKHQ